MNRKDFELLIVGLNDALSYAKGQANVGVREHKVKVDQAFVAAAAIEETRDKTRKLPRPGRTTAA